MKKMVPLIVSAFVIFLSGCSSSNKSTGVWVNKEKIQGKSFSSVFIVVMTADAEARNLMETDLAAAATAKGYKAVKSIDVMPGSITDPAVPEKTEIVTRVKASNCDAVFVASLLKKEEDVRMYPAILVIRLCHIMHGVVIIMVTTGIGTPQCTGRVITKKINPILCRVTCMM